MFHSREEGFPEIADLKDKYGGRYIATAIYGSYDSPEVLVLRNFRDNYFEKRKGGRIFVGIYYKYSPALVRKMGAHRTINFITKFVSDKLVSYLSKK